MVFFSSGHGAKPDGKSSAGGKGKRKSTVAHGATAYNEHVFDPDNLSLPAPPSDPLLVGAFHISPRVGRVAPGETFGAFITDTLDP
jgi:hypothetical protein